MRWWSEVGFLVVLWGCLALGMGKAVEKATEKRKEKNREPDCSGLGKWKKEDLIRSEGEGGPQAFTEEELASVDSEFQEVPLECFGVKPMEEWESGKVDGDLAFDDSAHLTRFIDNSNSLDKSATSDSWRRWPNGEVVYVIAKDYGTYSRSVILKAMKEIQKKSCITFKARSSEYDYVEILPDSGCYSLVGRSGGKQPLSLDSGCIQSGTIVHELLHVLGFFHEQSRPDRDDWVEIVWDNILGNMLSDTRNQFSKYQVWETENLGVGYDYSSILHYSPYAYSNIPSYSNTQIKRWACKFCAFLTASLNHIAFLFFNKILCVFI